MHELSIVQAILEQVSLVMADRHGYVVTGITLRIGPLAGINPALLRVAYLEAKQETLAERAELFITAVPVRVYCQECIIVSEAGTNHLVCRRCGGTDTILMSGDDMLLESVNVSRLSA